MQFAIAGLLSTGLLAFALSSQAPKVLIATAQPSFYFWTAAVGLVLFALPNMLVIWATSQLSSARIGVLMMTEVVVGTVAIMLLSAQPISAIQIFGAVLIFAAGIAEIISRDVQAHPLTASAPPHH